MRRGAKRRAAIEDNGMDPDPAGGAGARVREGKCLAPLTRPASCSGRKPASDKNAPHVELLELIHGADIVLAPGVGKGGRSRGRLVGAERTAGRSERLAKSFESARGEGSQEVFRLGSGARTSSQLRRRPRAQVYPW